MRSLLLLAAAPAARAILSDACQIALGEDDFFEAFKASKVAVHFNASNAACEHSKRSFVNDFLGGQLTKDTSVACGCHREYLARMCTRDDASLYVIQSANRLKGSKTLRLHTLACLPNDCTACRCGRARRRGRSSAT